MATRVLTDKISIVMDKRKREDGPDRTILKIQGDGFLMNAIETDSEVDLVRPDIWARRAIAEKIAILRREADRKTDDAIKMQAALDELDAAMPWLAAAK